MGTGECGMGSGDRSRIKSTKYRVHCKYFVPTPVQLSAMFRVIDRLGQNQKP
jgi:hypothetical protein